jgi:cation diffusion facilitator CzcD-associated flavoprotein CzcO
MGSVSPNCSRHEVIIVGAGFSGIYMLHKLKDAGFDARLLEAGAAVGGIWHWNCYPGARVDTAVPTYQLTSDEVWKDFDWTERFPTYSELRTYFKHLVKVWDLEPLIQLHTRVWGMQWDASAHEWRLKVSPLNDDATIAARHVILCTGFGSKPYIPPLEGMEKFQGEFYHTGLWPQEGVNLAGKRVAIIGTGASGVQLIQETAKVASHLTVFQRTPNTALPMDNPAYGARENEAWKKTYQATKEQMFRTFAGYDYDFDPGVSSKVATDVRTDFYNKLLRSGGLHFWLATYSDVLFDQAANDEAYEFWRQSVLPRINSPRNQELLAPKIPHHPFGTKRVSLENRYFEVFNQDNVELVSLLENPIVQITEDAIQTADGACHKVDLIAAATGFDSVTGGITSIDILGTNPQVPLKDQWAKGVGTLFGMASAGFPNVFFMYGPQAPTAFTTGPSSAECQGDWLVACLSYLRDRNITKIEAKEEAQQAWREHTLEVADKGLFSKAKSWYFGDNIPGKPREALNYMGGLPTYRKKIWESAHQGYDDFVLEG